MDQVDPAEAPCPVEVVDRLLWRNAQRIMARHQARGVDGPCRWCGGRSPCGPRQLAERADVASRLPMHEALSVRNDITRLLPMLLAPGPDDEAIDLRAWRSRNQRTFG